MGVRRANEADTETIMGWLKDPDFGIAEPYTEGEVREWIRDPLDAVVFMAEVIIPVPKSIGFVFAKRISKEWWMMDALYVKREYRKMGAAGMLVKEMMKRIRDLGGEFVNAVMYDRPDLVTAAGALGFTGKTKLVLCEQWVPKKEAT